VILTLELLNRGKSLRGGWSNLQFETLGVKEFKKGWRRKLLGSDIPEETIKKFIDLKDAHFKPGRKIELLKKKLKFKYPQFEPCSLPFGSKQQYTHPNWQRMRLLILDRDNFTCINCESKHDLLHVHHLKYPKEGYIWHVPHWYLVSLCEKCHSKEHKRDLTIKKY